MHGTDFNFKNMVRCYHRQCVYIYGRHALRGFHDNQLRYTYIQCIASYDLLKMRTQLSFIVLSTYNHLVAKYSSVIQSTAIHTAPFLGSARIYFKQSLVQRYMFYIISLQWKHLLKIIIGKLRVSEPICVKQVTAIMLFFFCKEYMRQLPGGYIYQVRI